MVRPFSTSLIFLILLVAGCAGKKGPETIEGKAGDFIRGYGFSIDASYDSRLDSLVPGYRLLTVAIRNTSLTVVSMDARRDEWVLIDRHGKKRTAVNSLRLEDRKLWNRLGEKVQSLVDYPDIVPISYTVTFNLFFPESASLDDFQEIHYRNSASRTTFLIVKDN